MNSVTNIILTNFVVPVNQGHVAFPMIITRSVDFSDFNSFAITVPSVFGLNGSNFFGILFLL